ncbi:islet cell autoantigen 1 isoform X2 [Chiloscyllium plagiosum]|uniref:islet cell autoantigen 1 isoform X2 n=1 Tax=Chiloscyllium plagiosum TaxID=36176 RepID=UPI001CB7E8A8|nr:islet cell autoantigen 1 isoform X2 [Chiloscyllium plagiosum]
MDHPDYGYARELYSRYVRNQDSSVVNKMQQRYWKTKQTFIKVTGKKEDEHVVASDADLDSKLEIFHSIQRTCMELLKIIEQYQKRICFLSQEENELGRFLRSQGSQDKTRAGKMMQASGKALCFSSQQRLALRSPLCRLYQEVETFRYRAISDTWLTVNRMEQSRTEYRGALLWMKDVSQELDPDMYKHLEKFRKVQGQVRHAKIHFDKLKNDVCQKVDLLGASRCNLLSHILATYQTTLLHFWEKTSHTMAAIHESFKGYQPYEFAMLKVLQGPVNKLIEQASQEDNDAKVDVAKDASDKDNELISLEEEKEDQECSASETPLSLVMENDTFSPLEPMSSSNQHKSESIDDLLDLKKEEKESLSVSASTGLLTNPMESRTNEKDEMALLNEILNGTSLEEGDFSKEWQAVFGEDLSFPNNPAAGESDQLPSPSGFLPSQLFDKSLGWAAAGGSSQPTSQTTEQINGLIENINKNPFKAAQKNPTDLSTWFNLFADLDPLSNPDAIGRTDKQHELLNA